MAKKQTYKSHEKKELKEEGKIIKIAKEMQKDDKKMSKQVGKHKKC
jgi:hypothetical protein